jgi:hypothetical protein
MYLSSEKRAQRNLKNAASVIVNGGGYPEHIQEKIRTAYDAEDFQQVVDLAAEHDIPGREALDAKIKMIPNPSFKEAVNRDSIQDKVVGNLIDSLLGRMDGMQIDRYLEMQRQQEEEDEKRRLGRMYELEEREPRFLFEVEGIDEKFKSAAKAIAAYKEKHEIDSRGARNAGFRRNPKFVNVDSPPEQVAQVIPKPPELPEDLKEQE